MKKIKIIYKTLIFLIVFSACTDNLRDLSFLETSLKFLSLLEDSVLKLKLSILSLIALKDVSKNSSSIF